MASKYDWNVTHSQEDITAERCNIIPGFLHESPVSCTLPSLEVVLGRGVRIRENFGLTCYGDSFVFMSSEVYFFNHSCCEKLYKVKLLIVPRK